MNLAPKLKPRPLKFGTIVHKVVETDIAGGNPFKKLKEIETEMRSSPLFQREEEEYGNIISDVRYIMTAYFKYWDGKPETIEYIPIGKNIAEHPFEIEIDKGNILAKGKMDAIGKAKKFKWLVEHKSHKNFPAPEHRWRNLQSVIYIRVADMMGWAKLDGTCWDYIRSKSPTVPKLLKDGGISKAAIDTLPQVVTDFLKENGLHPAIATDLIKQQTDNLGTWFQRIFTPVGKDIIQPVYDDFLSTSREMMDKHLTHKEKTFGRHCEWCSYRILCAAELQGHDVDFLIEREFMPNDYNDEEPVAD